MHQELFQLLMLPLRLVAVGAQVALALVALSRVREGAPEARVMLAVGGGCGALALLVPTLGTLAISLLTRLLAGDYQLYYYASNAIQLLSILLWIASGALTALGLLRATQARSPGPAA